MGGSGGSATVKNFLVLVRYYRTSDLEPTTLKQAIAKVKGVDEVTADAEKRELTVKWSGKCKELPQLEAMADKTGVPALVITHAPLSIALKAGKGASLDKLQKELGSVEGVKHISAASATLDLHVDFTKVEVTALRTAATNAGFEMTLKSHAWLESDVEGDDTDRVARELTAVKGVLVVKTLGNRAQLWATKDVTEDALRKAAEKAGGKLGAIDRP
jgi:translation elongation factor EF-1beta